MSTKCHLATSKCVVRLTFTLRAISSDVMRDIIVITATEVNPISHRRSVEIVSCVNALMRPAHLRKKKNGVIGDVTDSHELLRANVTFMPSSYDIYKHVTSFHPDFHTPSIILA